MYGMAVGVLAPAINAWTVDMSQPQYRGKAMATMYIALEAGIGLGALLAGWYYTDIISRIPVIMYASAAITLLAVFYMFLRNQKT